MEFITIAEFVLQILGVSFISCILIGILPFRIVFKMRKISKSLVYEFKKTKKFIPEIFVDINDTCEKLRLVVGGRKYRRRIRKEIKSLFKIDGRWLSKYWCVSHSKKKLKIPLAQKKLILFLEELEKILDSKHGTEVFSNHRQELSELLDKKDKEYYIVYKFMQTKGSVGRLKESLILNTSKKLIITSTAGNGKSSLLSYTVDSLIKSFQPVLFLNSRTLGPSPLENIFGMLVNPRLRIDFLTPSFFAIGVWNAIRGFPIVVVIDAINENDDDSFKTGLIAICEYFSGLPNYKVLMSCRNEYLEIRFHDLMEKLCVDRDDPESSFRYDKEKSACMFSINNYYHRDDYISPYLNLLIDKYHKYFKAKNILPIREYTRLLNTSLLLFRFYFESEKNEIEEINRV
ncbi:MAG TPA: hypothetical protein DIW48_07300, partial [Sphaerochaeta sp.]|nr:hypothetical protein [Sphaerochaeta sp.]